MIDPRLQQLKQWLEQVLDEPFQLKVASADASFRRYFRLQLADRTLIAMDAPPELENSEPFVRINHLFAEAQLQVPKIYAADLNQGFILLADLGTMSYLQALNEKTADQLYGDALQSLCKLQQYSLNKPSVLPTYSAEKLLAEMHLFDEWFLQQWLKITPNEHIRGLLHSVFQRLIDTAMQQPQVWVHRDYHSRNLMVTANNNPGIIDFQDAVYGPITYDLVSLLRDSYIAWPNQQVQHWSECYRFMAMETEILPPETSSEQWSQWFDWMGIQRQLKVLGIFTRLKLRDHKSEYLNDLPQTLDYLLLAAKGYPEFNEFSRWLENDVKTAMLAVLSDR